MPEILSELRNEIKEVDTEMVRLLRKRMRIVLQIAVHKKSNGLSLVDPKREQQVLKYVQKLPHDPIPTRMLLDLFQQIILISRDMQSEVLCESTEKLK